MTGITQKNLQRACDVAARAIPPLFPLESSVAVNPFLGQSGDTLIKTSSRLERIAGLSAFPSRAHYAAKIKGGDITETDLTRAATMVGGKTTAAALRAAAQKEDATPTALPDVIELASQVSGISWREIFDERFGHWAASHYDKGQALWVATDDTPAFDAWRAQAVHDLTPEIAGVSGFAQTVADGPATAGGWIKRAAKRLGLSDPALETYFHQLLNGLGGWAQYARYEMWQAELAGGTSTAVGDLLAIRLVWEAALFAQYEDAIAEDWAKIVTAHESPLDPSQDQLELGALQLAAELAGQRALASQLGGAQRGPKSDRAALQMVFCIDVRSEVFRRALETLDPTIETMGFAGFFGLPVAHHGLGSDVTEKRLPVLLNPGVGSRVDVADATHQSSRLSARARRAWGRFTGAAVSSFAFVEAVGPVFAGRLVKDAMALETGGAPGAPAPQLDPSIDLPTRIETADTILRAMSLTEGFAETVVIAGHGAVVKNNPHESALHCGACGGYAGDVNARLLAGLLNDPQVRDGLLDKGIEIPQDTVFVGALHDTTGDEVTLYDVDTASPAMKRLQQWLTAAGRLARTERALKLPGASGEASVARRSHDWSQTRPEWALAGCQAFVAAPRSRTAGSDLAGRAFLHDYVWQKDDGFGVLELILTAPVVVASWISLQYYGSTVMPSLFGGGNKLLHNVTGGIGVVEGNGGLLRAGLPWQSVHDGDRLMHDPLRLSVCIEAPREAITEILARHDGVRDLFDHHWLHLFALNEEGCMAWRYTGDLTWEAVETDTNSAFSAAA